MENLNSRCPDFEGRYVCDYFIENGACSLPKRFMCHVFIDTDRRPVEDDVPLFTKEVLEVFGGSKVVEVKERKQKLVIKKKQPTTRERQLRMEDVFGKI